VSLNARDYDFALRIDWLTPARAVEIAAAEQGWRWC
jgi:hypothetical protein